MAVPSIIAHYRIVSKLGEGGMGVVYRATDTKLNREVAIKILPESFATDPDRVARFEREARLLASLNHPNIAAIYGVEENAIVMEFVEGEDLHRPVPIETAIHYAREIAVALEAAHEKGIVHRDLKPANIKVTPDGTIKLLDFGLAKAIEQSSAASTAASPTTSPTLSLAMTQAGVILGTAAYMSPEQARGKPVDQRADIWAFGVVLYEMLSGRTLFATGETRADTIAAVMTRDPDWSALPPSTPPHIRRLLQRCLRKDVKTRLRDIGEARVAIDEPPAETSASSPPAAHRVILPWVAAAVATIAAVAFAVLSLRRPVEEARAVKFAIAPPEKASFDTRVPVVSPDGRRIVFGASSNGKDQLWLRNLDSAAARPLVGTEDLTPLTYPFWSPDSRFLGFFADGKLKRIDVSGGPAQTLCQAASPRGGTWSRQDVIVFNADNNTGLVRVPAVGGICAPATELDVSRNEIGHRWPSFLPDGRHFLYFVRSHDQERIAVWVGDLESKKRRSVVAAASNAVYDPRGWVLFVRENTLMAQPFDADRLETAGDPYPVADQVGNTAGSLGLFSLSQTGVLAYYSGVAEDETQLTWFDRAGKPLGTIGQVGLKDNPSISPEGGRVAFVRFDPLTASTDIWLHDLAHATNSRFTSDPMRDSDPSWSPDGSRVVFLSNRTGQCGLYVKPAGGTGKEELLFESPADKSDTIWSRDGKFVTFTVADTKTRSDIWVLPNPLGDAAARKPYAFLQTEATESQAVLSPDGNYLAYSSDENRTLEVYVQSFPGKEGTFQISTNGGNRPVWSRDGKELFYIAADQKMMAVDVKSGPRFEHGPPKPLFDTRSRSRFDVSPDGKRFLIVKRTGDSGGASLMVVLNWQAGMKK